MTLRAKLAAAIARTDLADLTGDLEVNGNPRLSAASPPRPAAVLIGVIDRPRPAVLLTVRTRTLRAHAGQIAFPGGRVDTNDESPVAAALREAWEEVGVPPSRVDVVGALRPYRTVTGYDVTPVAAVLPPDLTLRPQETEVADLFEAPLDHLIDPANQHLREMEWQGERRRYWEIPWAGRRVWGATAAMIVNLGRRLAT